MKKFFLLTMFLMTFALNPVFADTQAKNEYVCALSVNVPAKINLGCKKVSDLKEVKQEEPSEVSIFRFDLLKIIQIKLF